MTRRDSPRSSPTERTGIRDVLAECRRPRIAFFDYPDVFEDFYPHYGVTQQSLATTWAGTANHRFAALLQRDIGDVTCYQLAITPTAPCATHALTACTVKFLPSSLLHRGLWRAFYLPRMSWRWRGAYPAFATIASYAAPASARLAAMLWRDRPDVLFVQDYASGRFDMLMLAARILGVPLIARHSGSTSDKYLGKPVRRWTLPRVDAVVASGRDELERLVNNFSVPRERLRVILTPIDTQIYSPLDHRAACDAAGLDASRRYLLFVGRFDPVKRLPAIVNAFASVAAEHGDTDLVIVGQGQESERVQAIAASLASGRVHFLGWLTDPLRKAQLYSLAEALVLASQREGFPSVIGESMACGTPVIASRVGAVEELVEEGRTGWLVRAGDDEELRRAMELVLRQPETVAAMRPVVRACAVDRLSEHAVVAALRRSCADAGVRHVREDLPPETVPAVS